MIAGSHSIEQKENTMPSDSGPAYDQSAAWQPDRPRWRVFALVVSWLAMGVALMVAAGLLPGVSIESFCGRAAWSRRSSRR